MYKLTITLGICAVVFGFTTVVQSFRLWEAQNEAAALRGAAEKTQKDARKADTDAKRGSKVPDDNFPNPPPRLTVVRLKDGAASETAGGTGRGPGSSPGSAMKGAGGKGTPGLSEGAAGKSASGSGPVQSGGLSRSAQDMLQNGNLEEARSIIKENLRKDPKNATSWHQLVKIERQLGNVQAELDTYKQWIEAQPEEKVARYLAAEAYARNGMNDQALQYLTGFQEMSRDDPKTNAMVAGLYEQMNMPAEQGEALRQWVAAAPDSPDARRVLGDYYRQSGQSDLAMAEFQQMVELQPNDPTPYMQMGTALMQMGKSEEALTQFETAVNLSPNSPEALGRLALALRQTGDMQGAITNYQRIVDLEPGSPVGVDAARSIESIQAGLTPPPQKQP